ncbi:hypothetical protein [Mesorhizobium sp.]|uniref:hypothetical protein n=1 Tax=Mesorhizobium sp. TaxID=1871066 RepID=UPI003BAB4445
MKRFASWIAGCVAALLIVLIIIEVLSACLFVVSMKDYPGGNIKFLGVEYAVSKGNHLFVIPNIVSSSSDFEVNCDDVSNRDGYLTGNLNIIVFVRVEGCKIVEFSGY